MYKDASTYVLNEWALTNKSTELHFTDKLHMASYIFLALIPPKQFPLPCMNTLVKCQSFNMESGLLLSQYTSTIEYTNHSIEVNSLVMYFNGQLS